MLTSYNDFSRKNLSAFVTETKQIMQAAESELSKHEADTSRPVRHLLACANAATELGQGQAGDWLEDLSRDATHVREKQDDWVKRLDLLV